MNPAKDAGGAVSLRKKQRRQIPLTVKKVVQEGKRKKAAEPQVFSWGPVGEECRP